MNHFVQSGKSKWNNLAQEIRRGSREASERLVEELTPHAERIVRHTVRHGQSHSRRGQWILEEYHQLCSDGLLTSGLSRDELVSRVALRLCETMVDELVSGGTGPMALETVRGL